MESVLIAYASQMGSTREIASAIGQQLTSRGFQVEVHSTTTAHDAHKYDAVIVGSAVYLGHWDKHAIAYLKSQAPDLAERPTWLFQSGPCGPDADTHNTGTPHAVATLCQEIGVASPMTFGGNLDHSRARSWLARWVSSGRLAGDTRDWEQIRAWADTIADQLEAAPTNFTTAKVAGV
jgi:menaquinone-dependent protoporphyrinogen oxidase